jgi:hypothetical protein
VWCARADPFQQWSVAKSYLQQHLRFC